MTEASREIARSRSASIHLAPPLDCYISHRLTAPLPTRSILVSQCETERLPSSKPFLPASLSGPHPCSAPETPNSRAEFVVPINLTTHHTPHPPASCRRHLQPHQALPQNKPALLLIRAHPRRECFQSCRPHPPCAILVPHTSQKILLHPAYPSLRLLQPPQKRPSSTFGFETSTLNYTRKHTLPLYHHGYVVRPHVLKATLAPASLGCRFRRNRDQTPYTHIFSACIRIPSFFLLPLVDASVKL